MVEMHMFCPYEGNGSEVVTVQIPLELLQHTAI